MNILIENVIDKSVVNALGKDTVVKLNEAIDSEINQHKKRIESDMSIKFEKMVESISTKFADQVDKAIVESVKERVSPEIDSKLTEVVSGMINLLEHAGVYNTEKSKELTSQLKMANKKLEDAYKEREVINSQLDGQKKENFILQRLAGMRPEVISAALSYFDKKDMLDVQDEIDAFIEGDFKSLLHDDADNFDDGLSDITLDQVDDVLNDISSVREHNNARAKFESLGRGLAPQKGVGMNRNSTISLDVLTENADGFANVDDDTNTALDQIANYMNLGYKFM